MTDLTYADAVGGALDRLQTIGYEHGTMLVNHAPMAAEALATLGFGDDVATWVEDNLAHRRYKDLPTPRWPLDPGDEADWRPALGDFDRVTDWWRLFDRELADRPWREVLHTWWPRLAPGMSGVMTHGVIRTAHAVRAIAQVGAEGEDDLLYRRELAHGLGYWAARYSIRNARAVEEDPSSGSPPEQTAYEALDELVADSCGHYARTKAGHPVPLIHAITGPAAVRLVLPHLPEDLHWSSYQAARHCSDGIRGYYGGAPSGASPDATAARPVPPLPAEQLVADAVELGDEHGIKLVEVAMRHQELRPDDRYAAAAHAALQRLRSFLSSHSFYD